MVDTIFLPRKCKVPIRMTQRLKITNISKDVEKRNPSLHTECKLLQSLGRIIWKFLKKLKAKPPHDLSIPPWASIQRKCNHTEETSALWCSLQYYSQQQRNGKSMSP
jgi:hypothetical protein